MNSSYSGKNRFYSGTIAVAEKSGIENWAQFQTWQEKWGFIAKKQLVDRK